MTEVDADQTGSDSSGEIAAGQSDDSGSLSLDERFEILKNERRRIILQYLKAVDGAVKLDEVADHVTAIENDTEIGAITSDERKRVYVGLYQFHLPKMAKMRVIDYDQDRGDIELTTTGERLYQEYGIEDESEDDRRRICLGIAAVGGAGGTLSVLLESLLISTAVLAIQTVLLLAFAVGSKYFVSEQDQQLS